MNNLFGKGRNMWELLENKYIKLYLKNKRIVTYNTKWMNNKNKIRDRLD